MIKNVKYISPHLTVPRPYAIIYYCNVYWHYCLKELMGCTIIQKYHFGGENRERGNPSYNVQDHNYLPLR